jgi:hypothetical protein
MTNGQIIMLMSLEDSGEIPRNGLETDLHTLNNLGMVDDAFDPENRGISEKGGLLLQSIRDFTDKTLKAC